MFSALPPIADIAQRYWHVRFLPIVLKKSFLGDGRKFLGPLMRFVRGDVRDHTFLRKTTTSFVSALRSIAVAESAKINFCGISASLDFRLLQHYLPQTDMPTKRFREFFRQETALRPGFCRFC
jgi:hypothetical protein